MLPWLVIAHAALQSTDSFLIALFIGTTSPCNTQRWTFLGTPSCVSMKIAVSVLHSGHTSISGSDAGLRYPGDCIAIVAFAFGVMRHSSSAVALWCVLRFPLATALILAAWLHTLFSILISDKSLYCVSSRGQASLALLLALMAS